MNVHMAAMLAALLLFFSGCVAVVERHADVEVVESERQGPPPWHPRMIGAVKTRPITITRSLKFTIIRVCDDTTGLKAESGDMVTDCHAISC